MAQPEQKLQGTDFEVEALPPKQEHLVRCAYRVMGEKGMNRLSLQDVADEAGVSKAILPYYFASKENLVLITMRWVLVRVARRIREAINGYGTAEERTLAMLDSIFYSAEHNRRFYLTFYDFLGHAARSDAFSDLGETFHEICNGLYAEVVRLGQDEGVFTVTDPTEAATVVRSLVDGFSTQWLLEKDWKGTHPQYRDMCKRAVISYLTASP